MQTTDPRFHHLAPAAPSLFAVLYDQGLGLWGDALTAECAARGVDATDPAFVVHALGWTPDLSVCRSVADLDAVCAFLAVECVDAWPH